MSSPILLLVVLAVHMAHASHDAEAPANCKNALVHPSDEHPSTANQPFALLFDQIIKNGGPHAGPLIMRLMYLGHHSPEFREVLAKLRDKVELLLGTAPGSTMIHRGLLERIDDPYAACPKPEPLRDSELWRLVNHKLSIVVPQPNFERDREGERVGDFRGSENFPSNANLKERLTPPVNDFLMAALMVIALSEPAQPHAELAHYPNLMLMPWTTLNEATLYLKAVVKTVANGHFSSVNEAIAHVTFENATSFEKPRLGSEN